MYRIPLNIDLYINFSWMFWQKLEYTVQTKTFLFQGNQTVCKNIDVINFPASYQTEYEIIMDL